MKLKNKKIFLRISSVALFVLFLGSCGWHTFEEGTYNGKKYKLQTKEVKGFSTNRIEYRLKYANLPYIELGALTTDWGPVYSDEIYGETDYSYIPTLKKAYGNTLRHSSGNTEFGYSMLYFSPKKFNRGEYKLYADFFMNGKILMQKLQKKTGAWTK